LQNGRYQASALALDMRSLEPEFIFRTRRAIDRDEVIQIPRSRAESLLSAALAIAVLIFCINLARI